MTSVCPQCNGELPYAKRRNKFCSSSCSAIYYNTGRIKVERKRCLYCEQPVNSQKVKGYCSAKCHNLHTHDKYIDQWLRGFESGVVSGGMAVSVHIKKWLRTRADNKCEECGWNKVNPTTNKIPLQVDHIDGDAMNNRPENLRLICPNCHSLTSTYGGLNKGKGRSCRYSKSTLQCEQPNPGGSHVFPTG